MVRVAQSRGHFLSISTMSHLKVTDLFRQSIFYVYWESGRNLERMVFPDFLGDSIRILHLLGVALQSVFETGYVLRSGLATLSQNSQNLGEFRRTRYKVQTTPHIEKISQTSPKLMGRLRILTAVRCGNFKDSSVRRLKSGFILQYFLHLDFIYFYFQEDFKVRVRDYIRRYCYTRSS